MAMNSLLLHDPAAAPQQTAVTATKSISSQRQPPKLDNNHQQPPQLPDYFCHGRVPEVPSIAGAQIAQRSEETSPSMHYASACEKSLLKLHRWNQKLSRSDAADVYNLTDREECLIATHKFLTMLAIIRTAIEQEWIEHDMVSSAKKVPVDADSDMAAKDPNSAYLLPSGALGKQQLLSPAFSIKRINLLNPIKVGGDDVPVRTCMYCKCTIFNRGWTLLDTVIWSGDMSFLPHENHICCSCAAQGLEQRKVIMTERFSVNYLIACYRAGIANYNKVLRHLTKGLGVDLENFNINAHGSIVDDFLYTDPRPAFRSATTVSYHLFIRSMTVQSPPYCIKCYQKSDPAMVVACSTQKKPTLSNATNNTEDPHLFCFPCMYRQCKKKPLDVLSDRYWTCFVCDGSFVPDPSRRRKLSLSAEEQNTAESVKRQRISPRATALENGKTVAKAPETVKTVDKQRPSLPHLSSVIGSIKKPATTYNVVDLTAAPEVETLKQKVMQLEKKCDDEISKNKKLKTQLDKLKKENEELKSRPTAESYQQVVDSKRQLESTVKQLRKEQADLQQNHKETSTIIDNLKKVTKALATQTAHLDKLQHNTDSNDAK